MAFDCVAVHAHTCYRVDSVSRGVIEEPHAAMLDSRKRVTNFFSQQELACKLC